MPEAQKRILITGAASGLGRAIALHFARQHWQVVVADIKEQAGLAVVAEIEAIGETAWFRRCDVGQDAEFKQLAAWVTEQLGGREVLVNNAGVASVGPLMGASEEEWQRLLQINLLSCVRGSRNFIPMMKQADTGHIVNVASFAALALAPGMMTYNVAKAAVLALSEGLRGELHDLGIGVSVVCPAFFKTNLLSSMQDTSPAVLQRVERLMQHSGVTAEDVAADIFAAVASRRFMVISHPRARRFYRLQRWFPGLAFKLKLKQLRKLENTSNKEQLT
jgi:NAD(P)-dependent dehydrogenase (short-subunit alcohol dehydrogenase family)